MTTISFTDRGVPVIQSAVWLGLRPGFSYMGIERASSGLGSPTASHGADRPGPPTV
jgi:hypothetical protein